MSEETGDLRERELKATEYRVQSAGSGKILCSKPRLKLIDFYRTSVVLASESGKPVVGLAVGSYAPEGGSTPPPGATP